MNSSPTNYNEPAGGYLPNGSSYPAEGPCYSWMFHILPYVEQSNIYQLMDPKLKGGAWPWWLLMPDGKPVVSVSLPIYLCPSDPNAAGAWKEPGSTMSAALSSYMGCIGTHTWQPVPTGEFPDPRGGTFINARGQDGMLFVNSKTMFRDVITVRRTRFSSVSDVRRTIRNMAGAWLGLVQKVVASVSATWFWEWKSE